MNILTILLAVLVFGVLIFVHELGHFLTAKWAGMKVNEFALGMGPTLFRKVRGETTYALRLFPIGGFVAVEGEDADSGDERAFSNISLPKRILFTLAGALMNLLLGLVILTFLSSQQPLFGTTQVAKFADDAVSSEWLEVGDTILKVNGHRVRTDNDLVYEFMRSRDGHVELLVEREGMAEPVPLDVQFQMQEVDGEPMYIYLDFRVRGVEPTFFTTITNAFNWTGSIIKQVWGSFVDLLTGRFGFTQLSGPVGVTTAISEASSAGLRSFLMLVSFITVNLGVFNLLPIPALDGGRLLFLFLELIRRKPVNPKYEGLVHGVGLVLLFGLMIVVSFNDIAKLITG